MDNRLFHHEKSSNLLFEYSITGELDRCDTPRYWALTKNFLSLPQVCKTRHINPLYSVSITTVTLRFATLDTAKKESLNIEELLLIICEDYKPLNIDS